MRIQRHLFLGKRPRRLKGAGDLVTRMTLCRWPDSFGRLGDKGLSVRMQIIFRNDSKLQYLLCGFIVGVGWSKVCRSAYIPRLLSGFENKPCHIFPLTDRKCEKIFGMKHVQVYFEFDLKL